MAKVAFTLTFQDPSGQPLAGGSVTLRLNTDASVDDVQVVAGRLVIATLDTNGSAVITIWPNDQLDPAGTVYFVDAYRANGQPAWRGQMTFTTPSVAEYLLQGDGGRIEIGDGSGFILWE